MAARLKGTNQDLGRPYNRRIVLEAVRLHGPISRAEIARLVALSPQTISNIIREFEEMGLLTARRETPKRPGQPAIELAIDPDGGFAIGLQLTRDRLGGVLLDLTGAVRGRAQTALSAATPETALPAMGAMVARLRQAAPGRVLGVGLAMPGPFDVEAMSFVGPTTLSGWAGVPPAERLRDLTGLAAFVGGDAPAAALSEAMFGLGRSLRDFFYIHFGLGLGAGLVVDGQVHQGAWGNAGEFGHMPIVPGGRACSCGNEGCLETYVSVHALRTALAEAGVALDPADPDAAGHPAVAAWIEAAVPPLRRAICSIENLLDPASVVLGGEMPEPILRRLAGRLEPLLPSVSRRSDRTHPRLALSAIGADNALVGAAVLAISGLLSPRSGLLFVEPEPAPAPPPRRAAAIATEGRA
ncbi:ROK family transcriptional regulator [Inquilinus limosus]|uniref:ROK family transcriptional regulator n=1 Tax=Inquilinus limosus TaxID=171674 RepID=UPI003F162CD8